MTFVFQQPGTAHLLNAINTAAAGADSGGGVFAFASKGGVDALLAAPNVARMLKRKRPFHLIVGMDAITNAEALLGIEAALRRFRGALTAQVFYHEYPQSTFHPKFCWFQHGNRLHLIAGSGNLTMRGLGNHSTNQPPAGNWEAFSSRLLPRNDARAVVKKIEAWQADQNAAGTLLPIDDERIRNRAMENGRVRYTSALGLRPPVPAPRAPAPAPAPRPAVRVGTVAAQADVLLRELPSNRHGQADVGQFALSSFFGFKGTPINILVQQVALDGSLGPVLQKRLFANKSRNYRLELNGIAQLPYNRAADDGRMILVATKLDDRSFRYAIVPVDAPDYRHVAALLGKIPPLRARGRRMREAHLTARDVRAGWPNPPPNLLPVELSTPEP